MVTRSTSGPKGRMHGGVSLVVCTLNEAGNVGPVLKAVPEIVDEIVLVDGHSTDTTVQEALDADARVRVLMQADGGKGEALRQGLHAAKGEIVVQMDADGSMNPQEIPRFVEAICSGADVAKGSRMLPGGGSEDLTRFRRMGNWGFCVVANTLYRSSFTDLCYGFMAFRREVVERLDVQARGFDIEAELALKALRAGYRIVEVPSFEHDRRFGHSHLRAFRDGWDILWTIIGARQRAPAKPNTRTPSPTAASTNM